MHFEFEEELLKTKNHAVSDHHLMEYHEFIMTLHDFRFEYVSNNADLTCEIYDYLSSWLVSHIGGTDKEELKHIVSS